jgi:hypothetical protein
MAFMDEKNGTAHPFHGTTKSVAGIMAKCQSEDSKPLATAAMISNPYLLGAVLSFRADGRGLSWESAAGRWEHAAWGLPLVEPGRTEP